MVFKIQKHFRPKKLVLLPFAKPKLFISHILRILELANETNKCSLGSRAKLLRDLCK